jgi:hypothetical protein
MIHPSTLRALATRAKITADWLEESAEKLGDELTSQNTTVWKKADFGEDRDLPMSLKRGQVRDLMIGMQWYAKQIRKFLN